MIYLLRYPLITTLTFCFSSFAYGQKDTQYNKEVKKKYNLFNPVPKDSLKEIEADRPGVTENAITIAAGHFQAETALFRHTRNKSDGTISTANDFFIGNYKLGLTEKLDIQLIVPPYVNNRTREILSNKTITTSCGFDDITLRFKYNIWGNNDGNTALAALPFISFPTSSFASNGIQGGIIFPFALKINKRLNFGTQVKTEIIKEDDDKYHADFLYSFTFEKSISSKWNVYSESAVDYNSYYSNANIYADAGVIFSIGKNFKMDAGFSYGVNKSADKIFFTGFSFRL